MQIFLETDRLTLRRFTESDVDLLHELDSNPAVMRFLTGGPGTSREEIRDQVIPRFLQYYEQFEGFGFWAAQTRPGGEFLGWFHFRPADGGAIELGYRLRESAWGQGYATEGSRALISKGFTELGVQRVTASTMTVNGASRRVMEKCGLTLARSYDMDADSAIEGSERGAVEYELTRPDWARTTS